MNKKLVTTITAALVALTGAGCATQTQTEREFGDAVRAVTSAQTYDIGASVYANDEAVTGGDPDRIEAVINMHGTDIGNPTSVQRPVRIGVSNGTTQ